MITRKSGLLQLTTLISVCAAACAVQDDAARPSTDELGRQQQALVTETQPFEDLDGTGPAPLDEVDGGYAGEDAPEEDGGVAIVEDAEETVAWEPELTVPVRGKGDVADGVAPRTEASAAAKRAGKCIWPTFTRYPGAVGIGSLRYGQADVTFEICTDRHPSDWKTNISAWHNGTASAQGYDFIKEEIHTTGGGDYYRFYRATFKLQDCMPFYGWPCTTKGTFSMDFYAFVVEGKPYVSLQSAKAPSWWSLYKTR